MGKHTELPEYSQGILGDGAAILRDGEMLTIEQIVKELQDYRDNHARLVEALREVSDELADELRGKYHGILGYPSTDRDYAADMDSVNKARTLLAQLDGE